MAKKHIDRAALIATIRELKELSNEQKSDILQLISEQKKYGIVWEDSPEDVEENLRVNVPVLVEDKDRAIISNADDAPNHILIEGDNLEALTALSYTHEGKIDVIYIDPPYNTGNKDFVYNDSFVDSEDGYRHSKWLSFMEKRLKIAKKLLSDKGVIFISIDDNEEANLKLLCNEVFSNLDFVGTIPWRKRTAKADVPHSISQDYEWIVCYATLNFRAGIERETRKYYNTPDFPNKPWRIHDLTKQTNAEERPNSFFTIVNPKTNEQYPANANRTWAITEETFKQYYALDRIVFPGDYDFLKISKPVLRYWKEDDEKKAGEMFGFTAVSTDLPKEVGMTQDGTKDINDLFGNKIFSFPKPLSLIKYILKFSTPKAKKLVILDFFAGSGTTLHATMQLNAEDGGHRQCILCTNNENNICEEVTYERNKRVINGYTTPKGVEVEGLHDNSLRYYQIEDVPRDSSTTGLKKLMLASTDLLCIKNDLYEEQSVFGNIKLRKNIARYFDDGKQKMLIIYKVEAIESIVEEIKKMPADTFIKVYVFSTNNYAMDADFEEVSDKVFLCALPAAIYNAYRKVLPRKNNVITEEEEV